ncbi:FprA family A-type flavoprotein [Trichlorobacter ammonificans]|uniref:Flavo-diiron protein FprA1 n=1 Tax=Trichlorobacter ammonificans TaxID=2916410 RepID=A0ABN8HFA1_9BACT|nr:FprA family A-type flavoprotein [Trichlorobacter ammonificans]CAH2029943.1 Flavo-diiron protein FprA1 [Trichlorobacter ammonificans]
MKGTVQIREGIHWVGVLHPELRVFDDLFPTEHGTTYNSYLIQGSEKTALIDTVKGKFTDLFMDKIRALIDPATIDYIIVNHAEPDHSGSLAYLLEQCPNATVVSSQAAKNFVGNMIHRPFASRVVKEGDTLDLGGRTLRFIMAPFLHWPDTIFTRLEEENLLFTCDAFGAHYCDTAHIFNDETDDFTAARHFYFDCIFRPFKDKVLAAVEKIRHDVIDMILPSHGPIIRTDPWKVIQQFEAWSKPTSFCKKIVLLYISPHGNTEKMAKAVVEGAASDGIEVACHHIVGMDTNELRTLLEEADALIFGIPTIARDIPAPMWNVLSALTSVKLKTTMAAVFGSYGWSGEACKMAEERLKGLGFKLVAEPVRTTFTPTADILEQCVELGRKVAGEVAQKG